MDVVFVDDRKLEDKFIAQWYGVNRRDIMHNDFVVVGPLSDPAPHFPEAPSRGHIVPDLCFGSTFISRGEPSGTNAKELDIWDKRRKPEGSWYKDAGQGMGEVLVRQTASAHILRETGAPRRNERQALVFEHSLRRGQRAVSILYGVMRGEPSDVSGVNYPAHAAPFPWSASVLGQRVRAGSSRWTARRCSPHVNP